MSPTSHATESATRTRVLPDNRPLSAVFPALVAVADDGAAEAAIRITNILARERGAIPTVLRVLDLSTYTGIDASPSILGVESALLSPEYRDEVVASLEKQISAVLGAPHRWRVELETGDTGRCIATRAHDIGAELIVLGLRPHTMLRRAFVRDTVCDVVRGTSIPVLAVRSTMRGLPTRLMVAVDFSEESIRAAHFARELVGYSGTIALVYVRQPGATRVDMPQVPLDGVQEALDRLAEELTPTSDVRIIPVIRDGDPAEQLVTYAELSQPELIAMGSRHRGVLDRFFNDSVSAAVAHDARWSLLVVPGINA